MFRQNELNGAECMSHVFSLHIAIRLNKNNPWAVFSMAPDISLATPERQLNRTNLLFFEILILYAMFVAYTFSCSKLNFMLRVQ